MSSNKLKWHETMEITYEGYMNPPWHIPHPSVILLFDLLAKQVGKEEALKLAKEAVSQHVSKLVSASVADESIINFENFKERWANINIPFMQHILDARSIETSENKHQFQINACGYAEVFKKGGQIYA